VWCQGFLEPGAGSDLGSLRTHAEIDGDMLVVNGQKIWTSYADIADYMKLLVRTDRTAASKPNGISRVVCDMHTPGIDVRPIRSAARQQHFSEVFFDDVHLPLINVVGPVHQGWRVAMSTLGFERGTAFMSRQIALAETLENLIRGLTEAAARRGESVDIRQHLAQHQERHAGARGLYDRALLLGDRPADPRARLRNAGRGGARVRVAEYSRSLGR
jgi:alkylation response protein AidB-like acyl-CoA dehydrogenase